MQGFKNKARSLGAQYIQADVNGLKTENNRINEIHLHTGDVLKAGIVINAAGARAGDVASLAGYVIAGCVILCHSSHVVYHYRCDLVSDLYLYSVRKIRLPIAHLSLIQQERIGVRKDRTSSVGYLQLRLKIMTAMILKSIMIYLKENYGQHLHLVCLHLSGSR